MTSAKDIAAKLSISPSAVSIALNGKPGISEETRQLILKTAKEMGFTHKKRSVDQKNDRHVIYLFVSSMFGDHEKPNDFQSGLVKGISLKSQELGYLTNITYLDFATLTKEKILSITAVDCSGIILLPTGGQSLNADLMRSLNIPFITVDCPADIFRVDSVTIANDQGITMAFNHLYDLGHRNFGYIGGIIKLSNFSERLDSYRKNLIEHTDCSGAENILLVESSLNPPHNYSASISSFLDSFSQNSIPTAFICGTDWIAFSLIRILSDRGIRIPEDVSIVGFDNVPLGEMTTPLLTTVNVPGERIGSLAVQRLDSIIRGNAKERIRINVLTDLIVRDSTGPVNKQKVEKQQ